MLVHVKKMKISSANLQKTKRRFVTGSSSSSSSSSSSESSSSSSRSSGSDSDESSSSKYCDDLLYDQTYKPSQEDMNVNSNSDDIEMQEVFGNALSTFSLNSASTSLASNSNTMSIGSFFSKNSTNMGDSYKDISTFISPKKSRK